MHSSIAFRVSVLVAVLALVAGSSHAQATAPAKHTALDADAVAKLIQQGKDAFAAGTMDQAQTAFAAVFAADSKNLTAARDLGIVDLRLDKAKDATHPLEVAATTKTVDRSLVLALAYEYIAIKSPMQGVKPVVAYINAHVSEPDEAVVNAMGIALASAEANGIKSSFLTDCKKQYVKINAKLEATRKGEKRWGVDWMPAADEDQKQATVDGAKSTIASSSATIQKLDTEIADMQRRKDAVVYTEGNNNQTQKKAAYQKQIDDLNSQRASAQTELEGAQKTLKDTLPKWPENIPVESLTLE